MTEPNTGFKTGWKTLMYCPFVFPLSSFLFHKISSYTQSTPYSPKYVFSINNPSR